MTVVTAQMGLEARNNLTSIAGAPVDECKHIWTHYNGAWSCAECTQTTHTCIVNTPVDTEEGHPTRIPGQNICTNCHQHEQTILEHTANALGHWQHQPRSLVPAIRYDRDKTTGSRTQDDRPTITTPTDILDVLWDWAAMWAEARNEHPPTHTTQLIDWLKRHIIWAANNPDTSAWNDYHAEARQMRHHARRVAGLLPQKEAGPCAHCGGTIVRDWADNNWQPNSDGLTDTLRCTGCHTTWNNHGTWMENNKAALRLLPNEKPDQLVTIQDAQQTIYPGIPAATWRSWLAQDRKRIENGQTPRLPQQGTDARGTAIYKISDITALVETRNNPARRGPKAKTA